MNNAVITRTLEQLREFEFLDERLRQWAENLGGQEYSFPSLIDTETLSAAGYPDAFPHLLMASAAASNPEFQWGQNAIKQTDWYLSPAVCYHVYPLMRDTRITTGSLFSARGHCFRHEDPSAWLAGRRQVEFQMREFVLVGDADWLADQLRSLESDVSSLAQEFGLVGTWCPAIDPFFLPKARGKAQMQRILGTKKELCLPCGLAIASINQHGSFFGERFNIRLPDDRPAHSACVAFGLDRWAADAASEFPTPTYECKLSASKS